MSKRLERGGEIVTDDAARYAVAAPDADQPLPPMPARLRRPGKFTAAAKEKAWRLLVPPKGLGRPAK